MGALMARQAEEKAELHAGRIRAARFLARQSPTYIEDLDMIGMGSATGTGDDAASDSGYTGSVTEATASESASQAGSHAGDDAVSDSGKSSGGSSDEGSRASGKQRDPNDPRMRAKRRAANDYKKLLEGAKKGGMSGVWQTRYLLRKPNVHPNHVDSKGRSAMYVAAEHGNPEVLDTLVMNRAKVDNPNKAKWTPLHAATFHGQMKCMEVLIQALANINSQDLHGCTPLILAASSPKLYIVDLVSASDRRKRRKARAGAVLKQNRIQSSGDDERKGDLTNPNTMWKFFPNRIELIAMNILLKDGTTCKIDMFDNQKRTALTYAARYGRTYAISRLLAAKANPRHNDANGRSPLFHAAANGHNEAVEMFLKIGASPNTTDQYFASPLHIVLQNGDDTLANTLISSEASVNAIDCEGRTPIMIAMDTGNHMMFGALVERRSNLDVLDRRGWNVVMYAVETDMLGEVLPLLTRSGQRVKGILRLYDPQGRNSLHHAAFHPNLQQATNATGALIKLDPQAAQIGDCNGDTAVHLAAELGRLDILRAMGEKGIHTVAVPQGNPPVLVEKELVNHRGETPLMYAAHGGHMASVIALLEDKEGRGCLADAGTVDIEGKTLLMHACASGHLDLVNLILQNKEGRHPTLRFRPLDVNQADNAGTTALHAAASEGYWQLLPSLVLAGANKAAKDKDGCTALHAAAIEDEPLACATLIDIGLDLNAKDNQGWTPLMHAAWKGADDVVRLLVDAGASLDTRNSDGDTALQICSRRKDARKYVKRTRDMLTDGLLDSDFNTTHSVDAQGHFMFTVVGAKELYQEGKADQINSYVYLEFCSKSGIAPMIAYSTCVVTEASPQWHEVFRFDVDTLDPSAYLVAWVISAPGDDFDDIITGAQHGLTEEQLQEAAMKRAVAGEGSHHHKPDFNRDLTRMLNRQRHQQDRLDDIEVHKQNMKARMPAQHQPDASTYQRHEIPLSERRWNEVTNLRHLLQKTGCHLQEPLIPRTHLPLGCVVARFRHLRSAVWGTEPVVMDRLMRIGCKGSLRIEMDFRPRYFKAIDPLKPMKHLQEEEWEPRTPRADDLIETAESVALEAREEASRKVHEHEFILNTAGGESIMGGRQAMQQNPVEMYQKYKQVDKWVKGVLKVRRQKINEDIGYDDKDGFTMVKTTIQGYKKSYEKWKEDRAKREVMLDKQVGAMKVAHEHTGAKTAEQKSQPGQQQMPGQPKVVFGGLPALKVEPWLEEIMEGSRFM